MFDSGLRIGELLNLRFEDIIYPTNDYPWFKIVVKTEYSKTIGRTITLFWKDSRKYLEQYLNTLNPMSQEEPIFYISYAGVRKYLNKLGKDTLGKRANPHKFRKSSATHYASKLPTQQNLETRYGWVYGQGTANKYINRAGVGEEQYAQTLLGKSPESKDEMISKLKAEIQMTKEARDPEIDILKAQVKQLQDLISLSLKQNKSTTKERNWI
jgi:integrase